MFGVVLWSDNSQNRAVIWCEDHGDLAFFKGDESDGRGAVHLVPGDLVQFEMQEAHNMRLAVNPRMVASDQYPTLTMDLKNAGQSNDAMTSSGSAEAQHERRAKIIAFERKSVPVNAAPKPSRKAV